MLNIIFLILFLGDKNVMRNITFLIKFGLIRKFTFGFTIVST